MRSDWLPYDSSADRHSKNEVIELMRIFLYIIPSIAVILATIDFIFGYTNIALTTLSVPLFCGISLIYLNRGYLNTSMIIITSVMIAATSIICFFGSGIHEIGIMIFPVIVFFASLVMNLRGVVITTSVVLICLVLIVVEEQLSILPSYTPVTSWVDLTVGLSVLVIHTFITFSFANITKRNLSRVRSELQNQKEYKLKIAQNLEDKTELLRLVHHRVKNNLLLINSLIELEAYEKPEVKNELKEITDSIHTIARAHDPLYHTDDYKQVAIKPYLEKMITSSIQSHNMKGLELDLEDCLIHHEQALLLAIILQRTLTIIQSLDTHELLISFDSIHESFKFKMASKSVFELEETSMIQLLIEKMKGELTISEKEIVISFQAAE